MKAVFKKIPGARKAYRRLFGLDKAGAWLYQEHTLRWMDDWELRRQLPLPYRIFASYCRAQAFLAAPVFCGPAAFDMAQAIHRISGKKAIRLEMAGRIIFINPQDPRMLQVPQELTTLSTCNSVLARFISQGDTFIDIGANHGAFSVVASTIVGSKGMVVAFEPQPYLSSLVKRSLTETGASPFKVFSEACSDTTGEAQFFVPRVSSGSAGLHEDFSARTEHDTLRVRLVRLDDMVRELDLPNEVFIKLDVEGNEASVLRGASEFIRSRQPRILMEINPRAMAAAGTTLIGLRDLLTELGCTGYRPLEDLDRFRNLGTLLEERHQNALLEFGSSSAS